jgi:hypothetical protein
MGMLGSISTVRELFLGDQDGELCPIILERKYNDHIYVTTELRFT